MSTTDEKEDEEIDEYSKCSSDYDEMEIDIIVY